MADFLGNLTGSLGSGLGEGVAGALIGGLFGGGGSTTDPYAEARAKMINWLYKNGMKQYMPGIFQAYSTMMNNPQSDLGYRLQLQALNRESQNAFQNQIDPVIMNMERRGMLDSSMMGQGISDAASRVAADRGARAAALIGQTRAAGMGGLLGAINQTGNTVSGMSSAYPTSQPDSNNGYMQALQMAAQAYGQSQAQKPTTTANQPYSPTITTTPSNMNFTSADYFGR